MRRLIPLALLSLAAAVTLPAQPPAPKVARVVVRYTAPTVGDTTDHVDAIPGQRAQFTVTAYDSVGTVLRDRSTTWGVNPPTIGTTTTAGLVTIRPGTQGFGWIDAVVDGVRGRAALCVSPSRVTIPLPIRQMRKLPVPRKNLYVNASTSTATAARVELQALPVAGVSGDRHAGFGRCVHWQLTSLQTTNAAKMGRDGWVTLRDSSTRFTAAASVGVRP